MHAIQLLGKHLIKNYSLPKSGAKDKQSEESIKIYDNLNEVCCFTGEKIEKGVLKTDLIKDVFTDTQYLRYKSDYCSVEAVFCMQRVIPNQKDGLTSLRNYHYLCTEKELKLLKREMLLEALLNIPPEPFIFVITFGFKKHTTFKSTVNYNNKKIAVTTDKGGIQIDIKTVKNILPIMQKWYTVVAGKESTAAQPTHFSKDDILHGCNNYKKIEEYGDNYFIEDQIIKPYRNTMFLELLAYILNKTISNQKEN